MKHPVVKRNKAQGSSRKRVRLNKTLPCECNSKIIVVCMINPGGGQESVEVTYFWKHDGHRSGSIENIRSAPLFDDFKEKIHDYIENNMTWPNIKGLLRVDPKILSSVLLGQQSVEAQLSLATRVGYADVYYAMNTFFKRKAQKAKDFVRSLTLWGEHIGANNGYYFAKNLDTYEVGIFLFAFMSEWQLKVICITLYF